MSENSWPPGPPGRSGWVYSDPKSSSWPKGAVQAWRVQHRCTDEVLAADPPSEWDFMDAKRVAQALNGTWWCQLNNEPGKTCGNFSPFAVGYAA